MPMRSEQAGFSLLEALVAIMLTSTVILGLAGSLLAAVRSSDVADQVQRADSALGSFTESIKTMPYPTPAVPGDCPSLAEYRDAWDDYGSAGDAWPAPTGVTLSITGIEHWQRDPGDAGSFVDDCDRGDAYAHRLTVEVEIKGRARTAEVVVTRR